MSFNISYPKALAGALRASAANSSATISAPSSPTPARASAFGSRSVLVIYHDDNGDAVWARVPVSATVALPSGIADAAALVSALEGVGASDARSVPKGSPRPMEMMRG